MADGSHIFTTIAIVLALTLLGIYTERHRTLGRIPGVVWILTTGLLLSNVGLIPKKSPVYDFIGGYLMPLGIPLLLYRANMRSVLRESGMVLPIFLIGSLTVCIGAFVGFHLLALGPIGPKVAATYAAGWIGGMTDFMALAQITAMSPTEFSVALSASAPVSIIGLLALLSIPSIPFIRRRIPSAIIDAAGIESASGNSIQAPSFNGLHILAALTLSAVICAIADRIATHFGWQTYTLFLITILTLVIANLFPRRLSRLEGDFDLGMLLMYLFFAAISAGTDATGFIASAPRLFVFGLLIIAIHLALLLLIARWLKFDLAETIIGSGANIVGSAAAAGVASSKGWSRLVTPAIVTGMLGKAMANFLGVGLYWLLR